MKGWLLAATVMLVPWLGISAWYRWSGDADFSPPEPPAELADEFRLASTPGEPAYTGGPSHFFVDDTSRSRTLESTPAMRLNRSPTVDERLTDWVREFEITPFDRVAEPGPYGEGIRWLLEGDATRAEAFFDRALTRDGNDPGAMLGKALALVKLERWDDASIWYENLTRLCPNHATLWSQWVVVLTREGRPRDAGRAYRQVVMLAPHHDRARFNLAAHLQAGGAWIEALEHWRVLTDAKTESSSIRNKPLVASDCRFSAFEPWLTPGDGALSDTMMTEAWHHRGEAALESHLNKEAVAAFMQVTQRENAPLSAWVNLGIAHARRGRPGDALHALDQALVIDDNCLPAINQRAYILADRFRIHRDAGTRRELMHWLDRSLSIRPDQDNILALRLAAREVEVLDLVNPPDLSESGSHER